MALSLHLSGSGLTGLKTLVATAVLSCAALSAGAQPVGGPVLPDKPLAKSYNDAAKAFADSSDNPIVKWTYRIWCETGYRDVPTLGINGIDTLVDRSVDLVTPKGFLQNNADSQRQYPPGGVKFLDNAWVFGTDLTAMVVVRTPNGNLLMFDALSNANDMRNQTISQMAIAGLDVSRITHIFIGHAHGDHYGGVMTAKLTSPNLKVIAGAPDATTIATARTNAENRTYPGSTPAEQAAAKAAALLNIPDRTDITVPAANAQEQGVIRVQIEQGVEVVVMMTPGHTNGAIQVVVPVVHKGKTEKMLIWSGNDATNANTERYASGGKIVENFAVKENPTVWINTHTYQGATFGHLRRIYANPDTAPNPLLMGNDNVRKLIEIHSQCNRALARRYVDGTWVRI